MSKIIFIILFVGGAFSTDSSSSEWCEENISFKKPADASCKGYWECDNGTITYKTCGRLHSFDSEKAECVLDLMGSHKDCDGIQGRQHDHTWCSIGKTYKAPVNGLCDSYYDCQDGSLTIQACMWPMKFNPKDNECQINVWPYLFQCFTNTPKQTTTEKTTTTAICKEGSTYAVTNQSDCSKYYKCENGKETIKECKYWQKFDAKSNECRYSTPWNKVDCHQYTTDTTPKSISNTTPLPTSTQSASKSPESPSELICLKGNYYKAGDRKDCQKYYVCSNGTLSVKQCGILHRFDHASNECKFNIPFYNNVNCKPVSDKPVCKIGYHYKTIYPGNGSKYYDCNNGTLDVKDCGIIETYALSSEQCKWTIFGYKFITQNNQPSELQYNKRA